MCDIDPEMKEKAEKFRMRKEQNIAALVRKYILREVFASFSEHSHDRRKTKIKATTEPIDH